jgi:transposase
LAQLARAHDTRIWRVIEHHVNTARAGMDFSWVGEAGIDETSARRGQDYVSIFMDRPEKRVLFTTEGRDAATVGAFAADLKAPGGQPKTQIQRVCCDLSPAFIKGITEHLGGPPEPDADPGSTGQPECPQAGAQGHQPQIVFDRYHAEAKANEAVDTVRRAEVKTRPELKRSRYAWLNNDANLTTGQRAQLTWLTRPSMHLQTARAARRRNDFKACYDQPTPERAEAYLQQRQQPGAKVDGGARHLHPPAVQPSPGIAVVTRRTRTRGTRLCDLRPYLPTGWGDRFGRYCTRFAGREVSR